MTSTLLHATNFALTGQVNCPDGDTSCDTGLPVTAANSANLQSILQLVFGVLAITAVIIIIAAGFRFVIAQGDSQAVAKARQTIIYAVVGLLISISAELIVSFVLTKF